MKNCKCHHCNKKEVGGSDLKHFIIGFLVVVAVLLLIGFVGKADVATMDGVLTYAQ